MFSFWAPEGTRESFSGSSLLKLLHIIISPNLVLWSDVMIKTITITGLDLITNFILNIRQDIM